MPALTLKALREMVEDGELDLSAMQLTEAPHPLPMVPKVSAVDLSSNNIPVLPDAICKMNRLVRLDLGKNRLHHLPNDIGNMTSLQHLNLQGNNIEELPLSFANLKSLKWLDLRNNPLEAKLAKAAGNCGSDKECRAAAQNVLNLMSEKKKFVEYQKEKENKVNEKIKLKNNEEKKKKAKADGDKLTTTMARNAKSNGQKESSSKPATAAKTTTGNASTTTKKAPATARKATCNQTELPSMSDQPGLIMIILRIWLFLMGVVFLAVFGSATVLMFIDCHNGGKTVPGIIPLCNDFRRLANFEKPEQFYVKLENAYTFIITSNYKTLRVRYYHPYRVKFEKQYKKFKDTEYGGKIHYVLYKTHAFVVEKIMIAFTFVEDKINDVITWYYNGGHEQVDAVLQPVKVFALMVLEVLRDVAIHVFEALVYIAGRANKFGTTWMEKGFDAALKTLN